MLTLTAEGCAARRQHLMENTPADCLIITNPRHIQYLTGVYISQLGLTGYGSNYLAIDHTGKSTLIVHNFLGSNAEHAHVDEVVVWTWYDAQSNAGVPIHRSATERLASFLPDLSGTHVGIEEGQFPYGVVDKKTVDITDTLTTMRRTKDDDEIALIHEAIDAIAAGHRAAREHIAPGKSELDLYTAVESAIVHAAGTAVLMLGDFASGERAWAGGGPATTRVMNAGDYMIFDLFPVVNGYKGDYTATLSVDGTLNDTHKRLQDALHAAVAAGEAALKPGNIAGDVYRATYQPVLNAGFSEENIRHHAGHGLGLGHPEPPFFVPNSTEVLEVGDVVTLEPGAYGNDFGARIEHNYLITETGFERLTHHNTSFT
ncbi:MAG: Xaa-Pro peptidase family protein [Chloroflexota bacterium]